MLWSKCGAALPLNVNRALLLSRVAGTVTNGTSDGTLVDDGSFAITLEFKDC